jgi:hypothetical protein
MKMAELSDKDEGFYFGPEANVGMRDTPYSVDEARQALADLPDTYFRGMYGALLQEYEKRVKASQPANPTLNEQDQRVEAASQALIEHLLNGEPDLDGACVLYVWRQSGQARLGSSFRHRDVSMTPGHMRERFARALFKTAVDLRMKEGD